MGWFEDMREGFIRGWMTPGKTRAQAEKAFLMSCIGSGASDRGRVSMADLPGPAADPSESFPLEKWEVERLATFNAEVSRGLTHTDQYRQRMARLQRRFNTAGCA